jgi:hypothetical protein
VVLCGGGLACGKCLLWYLSRLGTFLYISRDRGFMPHEERFKETPVTCHKSGRPVLGVKLTHHFIEDARWAERVSFVMSGNMGE